MMNGYAHLGAGTIVKEDHPAVSGGLTLSYGSAGSYSGWDRFGRILEQKWTDSSGSVVKDHIDYTYDRNSNRLTRTNQLSAAYSEAYSYDGLDRLIDADRNGANLQTWNLDELGNWASTVIGSTTQTRTHNAANELLTTSGTSWAGEAYDAAGNMYACPKPGAESSTVLNLTYDGWNRLIEARANGTLVGSYEYDAAGRRIEKTAGGFTLDYFWNESYQNIETRKADDADPIEQWVFDIRYVDAPILRIYDGNTDGTVDNTLYVNYDANFNVTGLVDAASGSVVERYVYTPYGARTILDPSFASRGSSSFDWIVGHQGLAYDLESGLVYNRARHLHTSLGRFIQRDPIGYADGMNIYQVEGSSPTNLVDPTGLWWPKDHHAWTQQVALELGIRRKYAGMLGEASAAVDEDHDPKDEDERTGWHFDDPKGHDRGTLRKFDDDARGLKAFELYGKASDRATDGGKRAIADAIKMLGAGTHTIGDYAAHGNWDPFPQRRHPAVGQNWGDQWDDWDDPRLDYSGTNGVPIEDKDASPGSAMWRRPSPGWTSTAKQGHQRQDATKLATKHYLAKWINFLGQPNFKLGHRVLCEIMDPEFLPSNPESDDSWENWQGPTGPELPEVYRKGYP